MSGIFNPSIFNNSIFNTGSSTPDVVVKTGTGGIDPEKKRKTIYKPTGLLEKNYGKSYRKKEGKPGIEQRIQESRDIAHEVYQEVFQPLKTIPDMTPFEVDREIGILMREKLKADTEEEELMMLLMIASNE